MVETAVIAVATYLGGTGTSSFFGWLKAKRSAPVDDMRANVDVAKGINDMALATLNSVTGELASVTARLDKVEAAQEASVAELTRVTGLFREALTVLRTVIDAVQGGRMPVFDMSPELRAEVEHGVTPPLVVP